MKKNILLISLLSLAILGCREKTDLDTLKDKKAKIEQEIKAKKTELKKTVAAIEKLTPKKEVHYPAVSTIEAQQGLFEHFFEVQGAIDADKNVIVTPEQGGKIISLPVKKGQYIRKGDVIARFDTQILVSNKTQLEEQLATAKYMYEKQLSLFDKGVGTEVALKQAEGQYKTLQKSIEVLNTQQGKSILTAPFSGYIDNVFPVVGAMAGPATPIVQLIGLNQLKIMADVSEDYLSALDKTSVVDVNFPAIDYQLKDLRISRIGKSVNPVNRTILIEVNIPKTAKNMVPNLMAAMKVRDYFAKDAIILPTHVILTNAKKQRFVFVVNEDHTVSEKIIKTGRSYKDKTEILEGLSSGDKVVDRGARKIVDGDRVEVRTM